MPYGSVIGQALQQPTLRQPAWNPPQQRGQMLGGPQQPDNFNAQQNAQAQTQGGGLMGTSRAPLNPDWQPKRQPTPMGTGNQQIPAAPAPPPYVAPPNHNPLDRGYSTYGPKPVQPAPVYTLYHADGTQTRAPAGYVPPGGGQRAPTKSFGG